ncbi:kinase-like domain-containing protein [Chytridium lagenaria]|nr:kinase-like domain-containing protein [Chytridium lagenaria]
MPPKATSVNSSGVVPLPDIQGREAQLSSSMASLSLAANGNSGVGLSPTGTAGSTQRLPDIKRIEKDGIALSGTGKVLTSSKGTLTPNKSATPRATSPNSRKVSVKAAANNLADSASRSIAFNTSVTGTTSSDSQGQYHHSDSSSALPKGGPQIKMDDYTQQRPPQQQPQQAHQDAYANYYNVQNNNLGLMQPPSMPMTSRRSIAALVESSLAAVSTNIGNSRQSFNLNDFLILNTLGTGSFGRVHLVQLKATGKHFAMKVLRKVDVVRLRQVEHTINEKHILERLDFPFLVGLLGAFQDSANLYLVLEYVQGGELFSYLRKSGRFPNHIAKFYAAEVVMAFEYLHSKDIIYRDLKPENLLIDAKGHIKITDFGFAKVVPDVTWTLCAVDWWALGILIYEMIAGHPPFFDDDHFKLYEKILACKLRFPPHFDPLAKDLRYGNLKAGADDIKRHRWFSDVDWNKLVNLEIPSPYQPRIGHEGDTSNFDRYDENHEPYGSQGRTLTRTNSKTFDGFGF